MRPQPPIIPIYTGTGRQEDGWHMVCVPGIQRFYRPRVVHGVLLRRWKLGQWFEAYAPDYKFGGSDNPLWLRRRMWLAMGAVTSQTKRGKGV